MWLIVGQMPIKAGWRDAFLALWYFSRSNKHYIQLSTTTSLASLLQCPHFRSSRPDLFCKKGFLKNFAKFIAFLCTGFSYEFHDILRNTYFRRTPPVTASGICTNKSAAEACEYVFFLWRNERLHFHMSFPQKNHFLH